MRENIIASAEELREEIVASFGAEWGDILRPVEWAESQHLFREDVHGFLVEAWIRTFCDRVGADPGLADAFSETLSAFDNHSLRRLFWHFHYLLFVSHQCPAERMDDWPPVPPKYHPSSLLFYCLLLLSGVPSCETLYDRRGIASEQADVALRGVGRLIESHWRSGGKGGLVPGRWAVYPLLGRIFRLGRLEFLMENTNLAYHVFQHRDDGRVVALAGDGMRFRRDGQFDGANGVYDDTGAWTAQFGVDDGSVAGNPISPYGVAVPEPLRLDLAEWEAILQPGDPVVSVHIPPAGKMDMDACAAAFEQALAFFPRHFPERPFRVFTCHSWLMDPQLEQHLSPDANIVRFLQEYYLLPTPRASDKGIYRFVFKAKPEDVATLPRETSLQRTIIDFTQSGGHWRGTAGLLVVRGMRFGEQPYRKMHEGKRWALRIDDLPPV